jgi:hypothetical protein
MRRRADDAGVHPAVAALSLEEKGFVLGAALARRAPAEIEARVPGAAGTRCAAALAVLADEARGARAAALAALTALARAPVPAGIERIHPDWLRERFARESRAVARAVAADLPEEVRALAREISGARGDDGHQGQQGNDGLGADERARLQRVVFGGLVPLAGPGAPPTPIARELAALALAELVRAIERRGAETLGRSLRGAPADVIARAAASVGERLAAVVLEAARGRNGNGDGDAATRDEARRQVAAAGAPAADEVALGIGLQALAAVLESEGGAAIMAIALRLPPALGRRLLAAADGNG